MRIKSLTISNFRRYSSAVTIEFDNLTAFVGKNDAGKSSVLEALDIFFNDNGEMVMDALLAEPGIFRPFSKEVPERLKE